MTIKTGWTWAALICAFALLLGAPAPEQAAAQSGGAGLAKTVSSAGREAGCLYWSYTRELTNNRKRPDKQRLTFSLRNDCQRSIHFALAWQTGYNDGADYRMEGSLLPGESYSDNRSTVTYTPSRERYFNFWVFQSDSPISFKAGNKPILTLCNPKHRKIQKLVRENPPCPPHFTAG